jgi:fatty acid desaturase
LRASALPFFLLRFRDIVLFPLGLRGDVTYIEDKAWPEVRRWGRWLLALYAALLAGSLALGTDGLVWVWLLPLVIGAPLLRLYLVCEHTLCPNSDDGFANTRTTTSNPIVRFLMWNLPYHAEHHLFPNIAFYRLPEAHQYLRPHLKFVAKGYVQVNREIVRSFASPSLSS